MTKRDLMIGLLLAIASIAPAQARNIGAYKCGDVVVEVENAVPTYQVIFHTADMGGVIVTGAFKMANGRATYRLPGRKPVTCSVITPGQVDDAINHLNPDPQVVR